MSNSIKNKFLDLELTFKELDRKIARRFNDINQKTETGYQKVKKYCDDHLEKSTEDCINSFRDFLLERLIKKRNEQISTFNDDIENGLEDPLKIKSKYDSILKYELLCFKPSYLNFNEWSIMYKCKLSESFGLAKLDKYSKILLNKKKFNLSKIKKKISYYDPNWGCNSFIFLSPEKLFIQQYRRLFIINNEGDILYSRELHRAEEKFYNYLTYKASYSNIFCLAKDANDSSISIFDFRLELYYLLRIDASYFYFDIILNITDNKIAMQSLKEKKISIFNVNTRDFEHLSTDTQNDKSVFQNLDNMVHYSLIHFNRSYFYVYDPNLFVHIIQRNDFSILTSIPLKPAQSRCLKFDLNHKIYDIDDYNSIISAYSSTGQLLFNINLVEKFFRLRFTPRNTFIYNVKIDSKFIEYDEY